MTGVTVVVDFGSAHTVVVARPPDRLVTVSPSVVLLSKDDQLVAGHQASRLATDDPSRLLTRLRTRLDEREVLVGDIVLPVSGLVRAVLARAVADLDDPVADLVLTHPHGWPAERVAVLTRAAAGLAERVTTVAAPVAAVAGADPEPGASVLVLDFGATSCEAAVVRRDRSGHTGHTGYTVAAHGALPLGGDDLDDRVFDHLGGDVDARVRKEQVVDTGSAPGLTMADLERLLAADVARVVELVVRVAGEAPPDRVLLVGGSSRVPMVGRRLAEALSRPVRLAADPEQAVAWGALRLANAPVSQPGVSTPAVSPVSPEDTAPEPLRPWRRRFVVAAALAVFALVAAAVAVVGVGPGQLVAGLPGPAQLDAAPAGEAEPQLPPEVAGSELVSAGQTRFAAGRMGTPVRLPQPSGTTLELTLTGVQAQREVAPPFAQAPLGYRWVTAFVRGVHVEGPDWRMRLDGIVSALDDRGQWIHPLEGAVVPCAESAGPVPGTVRAGESFEACALLPVPEATPVTSVVFGEPSGPSPVRFPVSVPAAATTPAPARAVGRLGEPAVKVTVGALPVRAGFHLVLTPSGYLGERRPAPGNRYVVVRAQLPAMSTAEHVYLRDDRGVLTHPLSGFDSMPKCPPFGSLGNPGTMVYACFVYELDADTPVAGVTLGAPLEGSGRDLEAWPTWTAR